MRVDTAGAIHSINLRSFAESHNTFGVSFGGDVQAGIAIEEVLWLEYNLRKGFSSGI